jgi:hypothetical protein
MSWLDPLEPDDALAQLLTDWRGELDAHAGTSMSTGIPALPGRPRRWVRAHQRTAAATAIVVVMAGSTTVAAAASGSSGPLGGVHDFLYGKGQRTMQPPAAAVVDQRAGRAARWLDDIEARVRAAQSAGAISTSARAVIAHQLDLVQALLDSDEQAPAHLLDRLGRLRDELAAIPAPASPAPVAPHRGHGSDDNGDHGSSDRQGDGTHSGDDRHGQNQDGTQGSDGGDDGHTDGTGDSSDDGSGDNSGDNSGNDSQVDSGHDDQGGRSGHRGDSSASGGDDSQDESGDGSGDGSASSDSHDGYPGGAGSSSDDGYTSVYEGIARR